LTAYTRMTFVPSSLRMGISRAHPASSANGSVKDDVPEVVPFELTSCWYATPRMKNSVPLG
jgi:hypothetical protein